jgi:hypothetical protein
MASSGELGLNMKKPSTVDAPSSKQSGDFPSRKVVLFDSQKTTLKGHPYS